MKTCIPSAKHRRQVLILACGRSGTAYMSRLLAHYGKDVAHERIGKDGAIGWMYAGSHAFSDGCETKHKYLFDWVLHQVRDPLQVIASAATHNRRYWSFVRKELKNGFIRNSLRGRMLYWYKWNTLCEGQAVWTYRIEDISVGAPSFRKLQALLDLPDMPFPQLRADINTRRNGRQSAAKYKDRGWKDLFKADFVLARQIARLAESYGYETSKLGPVTPGVWLSRRLGRLTDRMVAMGEYRHPETMGMKK